MRDKNIAELLFGRVISNFILQMVAWLFVLVTYKMYLHTASLKHEIVARIYFVTADWLAKFVKIMSCGS